MPDAAPRHQQRERALSLLYEAELKDEDARTILAALPVPPDPYARTLVEHAAESREEVGASPGGPNLCASRRTQGLGLSTHKAPQRFLDLAPECFMRDTLTLPPLSLNEYRGFLLLR